MPDHTSPEPLPLWQRLNDFAEAYASGDRRLATLKRDALVTKFLGGPMRPQAAVWRCFHCDETFTDAAAARAHFGDSERQQAICTIDAVHFRWMEEQHRRNVDEDSEALRAIGRLTSEHETLRRRAEEEGYARGLRDAKKYPGEMGLISIESASTILDYSVAIFEGLGDAAAISTTAEDVQRDIDHLIETKGPKMERFGPLREQGEQLLADTLKLMRNVHAQRVEREAATKALEVANEAIDSIALAGMSGSGQESEEGMRDWHAQRAWDFIRIAASAKTAIKAVLAPSVKGGER